MTVVNQQELDEAVAAFAKKFNWSERNVRVAIRAKCYCEYCGRDLMSSVDSYFSFTVDHLIPRKTGAGVTPDGKNEDIDNLVLSCRTCNVNLKGQWVPRLESIQVPTRENYLCAARRYVKAKREEQEARLKEEVSEILRLL